MDQVPVLAKSGIENKASYDVAILGAGISGLVAASILAGQSHKRILVIDTYPHVGGNHIDFSVDDFTFDIGSLIFQDDSPLLRHFPEILDRYVPIEPTFGRINPQGAITRYPISVRDDLLGAGFVELVRILSSVAYARLFHRKQDNARAFARYWIGERLLWRSGLERYMKRFYGVPAADIDVTFAKARMLWISERAKIAHLLRNCFVRKPQGPKNQQLARPKEGFAALYRPAVERLEGLGVAFALGSQIESIQKDGNGFRIAVQDQVMVCDRIISTIPIEHAQKLCGFSVSGKLNTTTLISLFISFEGRRGFPQSVLFNFDHAGAWKRLTVYSDFYGAVRGREYFGVEVNGEHAGQSAEMAMQDFCAHTNSRGLFLGDLKLEGSHRLETAYPVYTNQADVHAADALAQLRAFGIESFGRQGGFDYQPTARVSTITAETALGYQRGCV